MDTWGKPRKEIGFLIPVTVHGLICVLLSLKGERQYKFHCFQKLLNIPVVKSKYFLERRKAALLFKCFKRK